MILIGISGFNHEKDIEPEMQSGHPWAMLPTHNQWGGALYAPHPSV